MSIRKLFSAATLVGLTAALVTACSDSPVAPKAAPVSPQVQASPATLAADFVDINAQFGWLPAVTPVRTQSRDTTVQKFTVDPTTGALLDFGSGNKMVIYPWAICDPATSGYGPSYWLKSCTQTTKKINFVFKSWTTSAGRPAVDISPNVRFVPGSLVRVYFHDASLTSFSTLYIPYCSNTGTCVNEGLSDSFQTTYYAPGVPGFWVFRNLRHFSGYNVTAF
ncbi:MAG: hypothetical protein U0132_09410 [Gemmatimonadaceae bacterium]